MSNKISIAIVGAGASGLFLAKKLSENSANQLFLFEKSTKVGTKLKASGGGKANILNTDIQDFHYNNVPFMSNFLQKVSSHTIQNELMDMGLKMSVDNENRVYPSTFFSQTVVDVLLQNISEKVTMEKEYEVTKIEPVQSQWRINDYPALFDKVILATGSPAGMIAANRHNYNHFLTYFSLKRSDFRPSLVGFRIKNYYRKLSGCRVKAQVALCLNEQTIFQEKGEVIFKDDGVSGIVILNCSAYYNRLVSKSNCYLSLDLMNGDHSYNLEEHWKNHHSFCGILPPKLNEWYEQKPFDLRDLRMYIEGTYDIEMAQVCTGGIDVSELDAHLQLKKYKNIYVTGELIDIDGVCGGYNLFFAFACAYIVAQEINNGN